jgi:hypothetical protein
MYVLSLTKFGSGYILGNVFKNSSGHPACAAPPQNPIVEGLSKMLTHCLRS